MPDRATFLAGMLATLCPLSSAAGAAAPSGVVPDPTVTVSLNAAPGGDEPGPLDGNHLTPTTLASCERWAMNTPGASPAAVSVTPDENKESVWTLGTTDRLRHAGLEVLNKTEKPLHLRVALRLPRGLWRIDAALLSGVLEPVAERPGELAYTRQLSGMPLLWRMESAWQRSIGTTVKSLRLLPGQAIFLRTEETIATADGARRAARTACAGYGGDSLRNQLLAALDIVGDGLETLPILVERGDRDKLIKRVHTGLLATAKAEAVWQNARDASADEQDAAFDALNEALSEISLAACNLVPSQKRLPPSASGQSSRLQVAVTNAGPRPLPLVSLGLARHRDGTPTADRKVFGPLVPGAKATATFAVRDEQEAAVLQFITANGAATVPVIPAGPADAPADEDSAAAQP